MFPLEDRTLFLTLAGSQAHGTARPGSDVDLRGVCIAPLAVRLSLSRAFEQHEGSLPEPLLDIVRARLAAHPSAGSALAENDCVIYDIAKFLELCAAANPNALEILFADERDWVLERSAWRRVHAERRRFLTRRVQQTFSGYAMAQLRKIRTHRSWLLQPPTGEPTREDFGLPPAGTLSPDDRHRIEEGIVERVRRYGVDDLEMPKATRLAVEERLHAFAREALAALEDDLEERLRAVASHALRIPAEVVVALNAEKRYRAASKHWAAYQTWKSQRNPARAELESRHGYDTKHAMHLIRLMRMGLEALQTGELRVRRDDATELSAIRDGALSFEALLDAARRLQTAIEAAGATSALPDDVDPTFVDALLLDLVGTELA